MAQRNRVADILKRHLELPDGLCIHGYEVKVKKRNLKRRSSLLKHAKFLQNLEVLPIMPEPKEEEKKEGEEEEEAD